MAETTLEKQYREAELNPRAQISADEILPYALISGLKPSSIKTEMSGLDDHLKQYIQQQIYVSNITQNVAPGGVIKVDAVHIGDAAGNICGDVGTDFINIQQSVNGGVRGEIKNTNTGAFAYSQWSCINNLNNDVCIRMNNSTLAVGGLHNTAGASIVSAGPNGTSVGPGLQPLIIVNVNNDASSEIWFGTRDTRRAYLSDAGFWGFATTHARTPIEAVGALSAIRVANADNSGNYADLGANTLGELVVSGSGGHLLLPAASGSTFGTTSYGVVFADILDAASKHGYKIGFDSVGATKGYLRYNVDTHSAGSATWGHVFSGGPLNSITNWAFLGGGRFGVNQMTPRARVDFLDTTAAQLRLTYTDNSVYSDLTTDLNGDLTIHPTGTKVGIQAGANGQKVDIEELTELLTIANAAVSNTVIQIPLDAVVLAVSVRVTVVIPTAATFTVTGATSGTQFDVAGGVSTAANTTDVGTRNCTYKNGAAQAIAITPNVVPGGTTGRVRVTIHFYRITPATS